MRHKTTSLLVLALALTASAAAAPPLHPGQHYSAFASRMVCEQVSFQTAPTPAHRNITIAVSVAGQQIPVTGGNRSNTLDSAGLGVLVRIVQNTHRHAPLLIRAASVRRDCVRVNVLASWR
jgi:hypothetical protein